MNSVAEMALARARKRGNAASALSSLTPKVAIAAAAPVAVLREADLLPAGHFSRVLYLEGRRHALELVRDLRGLLELPNGAQTLAGRLSECMRQKPRSFALGVESVAKLLELEVANG